MSKAESRFLIETSAVLAALGFSSAAHRNHFKQQVQGGSICTSIYVRKETVRRWVCEMIELAQMVEMSSSVSNAFGFWSDNYGRRPKLQGLVDSAILRKGIGLKDHDTHGAAVEIAQVALDLVEMFDLELKGRTKNSSGCRIGGMFVDIDGNRLLATLAVFREEFLKNILDCPINKFLQFNNPRGRSAALVSCEHLDQNQKSKDVREPLKVLYDAKAHITCRECGRIGDQVIALEQPAPFTLVHTDHSYDYLCECTGRSHLKIRSNASFRPGQP